MQHLNAKWWSNGMSQLIGLRNADVLRDTTRSHSVRRRECVVPSAFGAAGRCHAGSSAPTKDARSRAARWPRSSERSSESGRYSWKSGSKYSTSHSFSTCRSAESRSSSRHRRPRPDATRAPPSSSFGCPPHGLTSARSRMLNIGGDASTSWTSSPPPQSFSTSDMAPPDSHMSSGSILTRSGGSGGPGIGGAARCGDVLLSTHSTRLRARIVWAGCPTRTPRNLFNFSFS